MTWAPRQGFPGRLALASRIGLAASTASARLGRGEGTVIGGRVLLALHPGALGELGRARRTVLVSATNGKTTTTRLLARALSVLGEVATNDGGANLPAGLALGLARRPRAPFAALEVDESWLPTAASALEPEVIVLGNLSRDQLDRVSEVRRVAERWAATLAEQKATVVANSDDPLVVFAAQAAAKRVWVAAGTGWLADARSCPVCGAVLEVDGAGWSCACGLARPTPDVRPGEGDPRAVLLPDGRAVALEVALPGRFNRANAMLALAAAWVMGVDAVRAAASMAEDSEVAGRFRTVELGRLRLRLLMAKNPAGWAALLPLVGERASGAPIVAGLNARDPDGHDTSWIWDVDFECLAGREVFVLGDRRADLALRLRVAGASVEVTSGPEPALAAAERAASERARELGPPPWPVDVVANYSAFADVRHFVERRSRAEGSPA